MYSFLKNVIILRYNAYGLRHGPYTMENLVMSTLENYGVYINHLWHISSAIKIWLNVVIEDLVRGLMLGWWTM